jgi:peptidoglycan/xylan/chitin deacetylase (PgdA/CDA1 family)
VSEAPHLPETDRGGQPAPRRWRPTPFVAASLALHGAALAWALAIPGGWLAALAAIAANQAVIVAAGLWPRSRLLGANWTRLPAAAAARSEIALTIDDGPDPEVTPLVLALLAEAGVRASFFCIGERALRHPELIARIVAGGHAIENHSASHRHHFAFLGLRGFKQEIGRGQQQLAALAGRAPRFFRAPAGLRNPLLDPALAALGLTLASWTRRGFDTRDSDVRRVARRLIDGLAAGDILLLHDGNAARSADGTPVIVAVLPELFAAARGRQLRFVTLADALDSSRPPPSPPDSRPPR